MGGDDDFTTAHSYNKGYGGGSRGGSPRKLFQSRNDAMGSHNAKDKTKGSVAQEAVMKLVDNIESNAVSA